jgi:hypothetical protein
MQSQHICLAEPLTNRVSQQLEAATAGWMGIRLLSDQEYHSAKN